MLNSKYSPISSVQSMMVLKRCYPSMMQCAASFSATAWWRHGRVSQTDMAYQMCRIMIRSLPEYPEIHPACEFPCTNRRGVLRLFTPRME